MKRKSLKTKFISYFLLIIIGVALLVGGISYRIAYNSLSDEAEEKLELALEKLYEEVDASFSLVENLGNVLASTDIVSNYKEYDKDEVAKLLENFYEKFGKYSEGIYLTDTNGSILIDSMNGQYYGVNVEDRKYFADAKEGKTTWSEVLSSKSTGNSVSVYSVPLEKNGRFNGMLGLIVSFDEASKVVSENTIGETGYSFMIDNTGLVVSHKDKSKVLKENLLEYGISELEVIGKMMIAGETGIGKYSINGSNKLLRFMPYKTWSMAVNIAEEEYLASARAIGRTIIMISFASIILGIMFAYAVSGKIVRPILKIKEALGEAATGKLDVKVDINDSTEIGSLGESFNYMIDEMTKQASIISAIENGNFDMDIVVRSKDDIVNEKIQSMKNHIENIIRNIDNMIENIKNGNLKFRGDEAIFSGKWRNIIAGLNNLGDSIEEPISFSTEYLVKMAEGADLEPINNLYKGDFFTMSDSMDKVRISLYSLIEETNILAAAAAAGNLSKRGNSDKLKGGYKNIVDGINNTLDLVIRPIDEAATVLEKLSQGDLSVRVKGNYSGDHGKIKNALNFTIEEIGKYIFEISEKLSKIESKDLTVAIDKKFLGDFNALKNSINGIISNLNDVFYEFAQSANQIATGSEELSNSSQMLSQGATEQASSIEEITSSISQIANQAKSNAEKSRGANELIDMVKKHSDEGETHMDNMIKAMSDIRVSSQNIHKIIKVIDDIAFQTNILALNAAVEAARAGTHGKGFAVVAEEVRNLAGKSANAVKDTSELIEESIKKVNYGNDIANNTSKILNKITEEIKDVSDIVSEVFKSSEEQAIEISEITDGINQVSQVIQMNSATAEETAAASEEMSSQAIILKEQIDEFSLKN